MPETFSEELKALVRAMLQRMPERRPGVDRVLRSSFIRKHIAAFLQETADTQKLAEEWWCCCLRCEVDWVVVGDVWLFEV